jgi:hypothetical protein
MTPASRLPYLTSPASLSDSSIVQGWPVNPAHIAGVFLIELCQRQKRTCGPIWKTSSSNWLRSPRGTLTPNRHHYPATVATACVMEGVEVEGDHPSQRSSNLRGNRVCEVEVSLCVDLGDVGLAVAEGDLCGFQPMILPYLRRVAVPQLVRCPLVGFPPRLHLGFAVPRSASSTTSPPIPRGCCRQRGRGREMPYHTPDR